MDLYRVETVLDVHPPFNFLLGRLLSVQTFQQGGIRVPILLDSSPPLLDLSFYGSVFGSRGLERLKGVDEFKCRVSL